MSSSDSQTNLYSQGDDVILKSCHICSRTFNPISLQRHQKICEKTKKCIRRNVFNSFTQRTKELGAVPVQNDLKDQEKNKYKKQKDHEHFSQVKGKKISTPNLMNNGLSRQNKVPSGYQQCPSCNRCFNEKAADRHITWCMEQQTRLPKTSPNSEALERLKTRVKYRAPLPRKKENGNSNIRLVKSAESIRESSVMRTHSSPPGPVHDAMLTRHKSVENCSTSVLKLHAQKKIDRAVPVYIPNSNSSHTVCSNNSSESQAKKAVKFKEIFPVYKKERNKNLDMLAALKLHLSELEMSDDLLDDCFMKSKENETNGNNVLHHFLPSRDVWTSDGEVRGNNSSSDGSLPSLGHAENLEQRMPRFCYNCGTKYPIVSAKFCCECGARRFVFGASNQILA